MSKQQGSYEPLGKLLNYPGPQIADTKMWGHS